MESKAEGQPPKQLGSFKSCHSIDCCGKIQHDDLTNGFEKCSEKKKGYGVGEVPKRRSSTSPSNQIKAQFLIDVGIDGGSRCFYTPSQDKIIREHCEEYGPEEWKECVNKLNSRKENTVKRNVRSVRQRWKSVLSNPKYEPWVEDQIVVLGLLMRNHQQKENLSKIESALNYDRRKLKTRFAALGKMKDTQARLKQMQQRLELIRPEASLGQILAQLYTQSDILNQVVNRLELKRKFQSTPKTHGSNWEVNDGDEEGLWTWKKINEECPFVFPGFCNPEDSSFSEELQREEGGLIHQSTTQIKFRKVSSASTVMIQSSRPRSVQPFQECFTLENKTK